MGICLSAIPQLQGNMNYATHSPVTKRAFSTYLFWFGFFIFMCLFLIELLTSWFTPSVCVNITSFCRALEWLQQLSGKQINIWPLQNFQQLSPKVQTCTVDKGCLITVEQWGQPEKTWSFWVRKTPAAPHMSTLTLLLQATRQGLQGPDVPGYWLDFFSHLQVYNNKPCDLFGVACKEAGEKLIKSNAHKKSGLYFRTALYSLPLQH